MLPHHACTYLRNLDDFGYEHAPLTQLLFQDDFRGDPIRVVVEAVDELEHVRGEVLQRGLGPGLIEEFFGLRRISTWYRGTLTTYFDARVNPPHVERELSRDGELVQVNQLGRSDRAFDLEGYGGQREVQRLGLGLAHTLHGG